MEFGLDQLRTGLRPGSRLEQVRAISTCRDSSNMLEPGRRPVRSQIPLCYPGLRLGRRPAASWNLAYTPYLAAQQRASRSATGLRAACDLSAIRIA